jgi:NH3-dependent NAD+ synthetase
VETLAVHALGRQNVTTAAGNPGIVLACHDKSELALGKCTHAGDLAPIADLTRTRVRELAMWINARFGSAISPALIGDQEDPLDRVITAYIEEERGLREIASDGLDEEYVRRTTAQIDAAEGARRRAAVGLKVTRRAFGPGRPMPCIR